MSAVGAGAGEPMPETQLELEAEYAAAEEAGTGAPPPRSTSSRYMAATPALLSIEDMMNQKHMNEIVEDYYKYFREGNPESILQFEVSFATIEKNAKDLIPDEYTEGRGSTNCSLLCLIALGILEPTEDILSRCRALGTSGTPFREVRSILASYLKPCTETPLQSADVYGTFDLTETILNQFLLPGHTTIVNMQGKYRNSKPFVHTVLVSNITVNRKRPYLMVMDPQMIDEEGNYPFKSPLRDWAKTVDASAEYMWALLGTTYPASTLSKCPKTTEYSAMSVGGRRKTRKRKHRRRKTHRRRR